MHFKTKDQINDGFEIADSIEKSLVVVGVCKTVGSSGVCKTAGSSGGFQNCWQ